MEFLNIILHAANMNKWILSCYEQSNIYIRYTLLCDCNTYTLLVSLLNGCKDINFVSLDGHYENTLDNYIKWNCMQIINTQGINC
jgi:hypothetical protein